MGEIVNELRLALIFKRCYQRLQGYLPTHQHQIRLATLLLTLLIVSELLLRASMVHADCLSSGSSFILVKTTINRYIFVSNPDCSQEHSKAIYSFSLTPLPL